MYVTLNFFIDIQGLELTLKKIVWWEKASEKSKKSHTYIAIFTFIW